MTCPSANASPCQRKCDSRSTEALVTRELTMNPSPASSRSSRFAAESMPASATTTMASVPCRPWNWRITGRMVCFSALSPSKQPISVLLAVANLAQGVLVLGLEVQRRHVVQHERDIAAGQGVREAQLRDPVPVAAVRAAGQGAAHGLVAGRLAAQLGQDPARHPGSRSTRRPGPGPSPGTRQPSLPNPRPS